MMTVSRVDIQAAPYNPRKINDRQRKALKASLDKHGLLTPLVYNEVTGNLVGGHQRLSVLDSLMRTKDYALDVAVVNLTEKEEVAANIALNNQSAMGEFDFLAVKELSEEFELDLQEDFLFDRDELLVSFGVALEDVALQKRDASADPELLQSIKDRKKEVREKFAESRGQQGDYTTQVPKATLTLVFESEAAYEKALRERGLPESLNIVAASDFGV